MKSILNPVHRVFAPGCALMIYKPGMARKVNQWLNDHIGPVPELVTCCKHEPLVQPGTEVINICPGCDKRFGNNYPATSTISLWEILAQADDFQFPDYQGRNMTILDACPTRERTAVHDSIRILIHRMNINLIEPAKTRTRGTCCGDSFYGVLPVQDVKVQMTRRASDMPCEEVVVYCVSCVKAMAIGGKHPRYLLDLLFGEATDPGITDPDEWHSQLDHYINEPGH